MFKQVKSALFWYYLYKFRKKVLIIAFLLITAMFANAIYGDLIQYLTLKEKLEYLELALLSKWGIIIFNLLFSIYLILTLFKNENSKNNEKNQSNTNVKKENDDIMAAEKNKASSNLSEREKSFLEKDLLKSKADILVER